MERRSLFWLNSEKGNLVSQRYIHRRPPSDKRWEQRNTYLNARFLSTEQSLAQASAKNSPPGKPLACRGLTPLNIFQALNLKAELSKFSSGSQASGWHLGDERPFTHPGKMLQKCLQTDTWENTDVKDRCGTFSSQLGIKVRSLAACLYINLFKGLFVPCCLPTGCFVLHLYIYLEITIVWSQICDGKRETFSPNQSGSSSRQCLLNKACTTKRSSD